MSAYLLDTTLIIDVLNRRRPGRGPARDQLLRRLVEDGHVLACCAINVTEVHAGMLPKEAGPTSALLGSLLYAPITREIAALAGTLIRDWRAKGVTLSLADATIAAVAIAHEFILITDNVKHYPMPDLKLFRLEASAG